LRKEKPILRPLLALFPRGNKTQGIKQLTKVAYNAFYTRTEAQYHLMEIYRYYEKDRAKALHFARYLYRTFPDNPYFERSYASLAFTSGWFSELTLVSKSILNKIAAGKPGYEAVSGRYASYFLGYTYLYRYHNKEKAKEYLQQTVRFAEKTKSIGSGYYQSAMVKLARIARDEKKIRLAKVYYRKVRKYAKRRSKRYKEAKAFLRKYRRFR
jgi:tetratricopeptide (TPR) repeat protein